MRYDSGAIGWAFSLLTASAATGLTLLFVSGCQGLSHVAGRVDRVVAQKGWAEILPDGTVTQHVRSVEYSSDDVDRIVQALVQAKEYAEDTSKSTIGLWRLHLYQGDHLLRTVPVTDGVFKFGGKQFRDSSGVLTKYVEEALEGTANNRAKATP